MDFISSLTFRVYSCMLSAWLGFSSCAGIGRSACLNFFRKTAHCFPPLYRKTPQAPEKGSWKVWLHPFPVLIRWFLKSGESLFSTVMRLYRLYLPSRIGEKVFLPLCSKIPYHKSEYYRTQTAHRPFPCRNRQKAVQDLGTSRL